jgi:hypothetical protein
VPNQQLRGRVPANRLLIIPAVLMAFVLGVPLLFGDDPLASVLPNRIAESKAAVQARKDAKDPSASPIRVTGAPAEAKELWQPGDPEWGVHIYWEAQRGESDTIVRARARRMFRYIVGLNANSIAVSFPFFMDTRYSSTVWGSSKRTPSVHQMKIFLEEARRSRLRVTLRPLLDEINLDPPKGWRGNIEPPDRDQWFTSYQRFIKPYLEIAEQLKVPTFVLGTELNSLEADPRWKILRGWAGTLYKGETAYAANWDNFVYRKIKSPAPRLGVDAYFPVKVPDDAPVSAIRDSWKQWLRKSENGKLSGQVLYEAGIVAQNGAYRAPGDFYNKRAYNEQVQANWYRGVCQAVKDVGMHGIYWWGVEFRADPKTVKPRQETRFGFINRKKTEREIRSCFADGKQPRKPSGSASSSPTSGSTPSASSTD